MTAETGTSLTGKIHHYYKCFKRKRDASACGKNNITRTKLEEIIIDRTLRHVLQPEIIDDISRRTADTFNAAIESDEAEKTRLEDEIAIQRAKSIKPMTADEIKAFIRLFAETNYEENRNKHRLFEMFVNKVILYDDKAVVIYNSADGTPKTDGFDLKNYINESAELDSPHGFKFGALGKM
jgi:hypothetical protein